MYALLLRLVTLNQLISRSIKEAIAFSKEHMPDAFLAVGGGSVIDTAKLMNLYTCCPGMLKVSN